MLCIIHALLFNSYEMPNMHVCSEYCELIFELIIVLSYFLLFLKTGIQRILRKTRILRKKDK